jgi:hypothetical protein
VGVEVYLYSSMTTALEGGEGSASRPGRSLLPEKTRYPLYRRLGGPQGRFGHVRKIWPSPGFDPRTVQPVASRYTDYTNRPTELFIDALLLYRNITSVCGNCTNRLRIYGVNPPPSVAGCPHFRGFMITLRHTTVGRTSLDE